MKKYLLGICSYNEDNKIKRVIEKFNDYAAYDVLIVDDGSNDGSIQKLPKNSSIFVIRNDNPRGAGYGTRQIHDFAVEKKYQAVFFVAGNDKDDAADVMKLVKAMDEGFDFVQGSRYLPGGNYGNMPLYRKITTKWIHPILFSLISGRRITDSTNGFRAVATKIFTDKRMDLTQEWLNEYELEPYIFYYAIKLGYKVKEVPVSKIYPPKTEGYTKMKPFSGWWSILRPLVFLGLGIKK